MERLILAAALLGVTLPGLVWVLSVPVFTASFALAGCRAACPPNPLQVFSTPSWWEESVDFVRASVIFVNLATAGLLVWRFVSGTPPRRRALALGAPIALLFLLAQATYQAQQLFNPGYNASPTVEPLTTPVQWTVAAGTSAIWYGFLLALVAAQLFAGRTLRRLVSASLGRPSLHELEAMVRGPLSDPGVRLGFWRSRTGEWAGVDGGVLAPPARSGADGGQPGSTAGGGDRA